MTTTVADWDLVVGGINATGAPEVTVQRGGRTWTRELGRPDRLDFGFDALDPQNPHITAGDSDVWVYRRPPGAAGTELLSRCRCFSVARQVTVQRHSASVVALGYRAIIDAGRFVWPGSTLAWSAEDQASIVWDLINDSQGLTAGALGVTQGRGFTAGVGSTGVNRDETVQVGQSLGQIIDAIAARDDGFDWDIDAALDLHVDHPQRGTTRAFPLHLGGTVTAVDLAEAITEFGNAALISGGPETTPVTATTAGIATDPLGRWERQWTFPTVSVQQTLVDRAPYLVSVFGRAAPRYVVTLKQGLWPGPSGLDVGDFCTLQAVSGPLTVVEQTVRVLGIAATFDPSGRETVRVTVEATT